MASDLTHCFGVSTVDFGHVNADKVVTNFCENTPQKIKFSINDFYSKCDQIRRKLRIWSHLLKKSLKVH